MDFQRKMVQYSLWANCGNECKFCLRKERNPYTLEQQFKIIETIGENLKVVDWTQYPYGVSFLGGEIYNIKNCDLQNKFLELIHKVIDYVILPSNNPGVKYSSVSNCIYDPTFLFKVLDVFKDKCGIDKVDFNVSFDLKYRYKTNLDRQLVLENIRKISKRYLYRVGVQMILTQYVIDMIKQNKFNVNSFIENDIGPLNMLSFLYPHPISTGEVLDDFKFTRKDLLWFLNYIRSENYGTYLNFVNSTKNSSTVEYTGLHNRTNRNNIDSNQQPILSDGKEILNPKCGHSILYQCYSDSDKCLLCDIKAFDATIFI